MYIYSSDTNFPPNYSSGVDLRKPDESESCNYLDYLKLSYMRW